MANIFIEKVAREHVVLVNGTGAALALFDFTVIAPYCAVADEVIASTASGSFFVEGGLEVQATELVTGELTFETLGAAVYFDTTTKKFSDTSTAGYYLVGYVTSVKDSAGVIKFEKLRFATVVPAAEGE